MAASLKRLSASRAVQAQIRLAIAHERGLISDIANWLARVGRIAAAHLLAGHIHAAESAAFEVRHRLERIFAARLTASAEASVRLLYGDVKSTGVREIKGLIANILQAATGWIRSYSARKVVQISESTRKILRRVIDKGQGSLNEEPQPPRVLAKAIVNATSGDIGRRRAKRIAITEIGIANETANFRATGEMVKLVGAEFDKKWAAVHDKRTRPDHVEADGQVVAFDAPFTVGSSRMMHCKDPDGPPEQVINCRCVTLYVPRIPS